ncbi:MAG: response regulator transcription factor [Sedimentisphaerales bacterium]|nr:response regulator transcription factor [Sedimentisphaerales bacterium]
MSMKILLADDHGIVRNGLRSMIEKQTEDDLEVIAEAENGRVAVELAHKLNPDIVIMDVSMPDLNGIEASRQILSKNPKIKIMALSMHSNRRFVADMLKVGVTGYVLKESVFDELILAIRAITAGNTYLSPKITGAVVEDYVAHLTADKVSVSDILTGREREVLQLMAEGKSTKQIAAQLCVSVKTVESNRRQIMIKLDIDNVAELTKYAIREGLTTLDS